MDNNGQAHRQLSAQTTVVSQDLAQDQSHQSQADNSTTEIPALASLMTNVMDHATADGAGHTMTQPNGLLKTLTVDASQLESPPMISFKTDDLF